MPEEDAVKCCKCFWVFPRALYPACTNPDCQHKFCEECPLVFLMEANQPAHAKAQPIPHVNIDMHVSSTRSLSAFSNGELRDYPNQNQFSSDRPSIYFTLGTASEGLSSLQTEPALSEQIVPLPEYSASGPDNDVPVDGELIWTCCECSQGPWLYSTTPACVNCGHIHCTLCTYEELGDTCLGDTRGGLKR